MTGRDVAREELHGDGVAVLRASSELYPGRPRMSAASLHVATGRAGGFRERDRLLDELCVRRLSVTAVELEPEVEVATTVEREARDVGATEVTADHRHRPRDRRVTQQVEVALEAGRRGRQPERRAAQAPLGRSGCAAAGSSR